MTETIARRVEDAIRAVVPPTALVRNEGLADLLVQMKINDRSLTAYWLGEGWPRQVKEAIARLGTPRPDVFVARRMSPGAQGEALRAGIGWVDESGGAEIALDWLVIARTGRQLVGERPTIWTPAVQGVAEALLTGTRPTVADSVAATGLSVDTCTRALAFFTKLGVLTAHARRGPSSARHLTDADRLLEEYSAGTPIARTEVRVGVIWRDPVSGVAELGRYWDAAGIKWAATGAVAAAVLAPLLTDISVGEVLVAGQTVGDLERAARSASVKPMEGGRLVLRPFPSEATARLSKRHDDLQIVPWPRIYAELRTRGVRGEDAAEHLREVMNAR